MSRQATCGAIEARERRQYAQEQLTLAEVGAPWPTVAQRKASGGCAVLAGIAAADAVCCRRLGLRSREQDHRAAVALIKRVMPEGVDLAKDLEAIIAEKDVMQYGIALVTPDRHLRLLRASARLVAAATKIAK